MQKEITEPKRLLNTVGNIDEPGFAKRPLWQYDRADIKAPKWRVKEWDYYYIGSRDYGIALTIADIGYVSNLSISLLGFGEAPFQLNDAAIGLFPLGKLNLPASSESGDVRAKQGRAEMSFSNDGMTRFLTGTFRNFAKTGKNLSFRFSLRDFPEESMVIATPFRKRAHFYYNQKINCMKVDGYCVLGEDVYHFRSREGAMATMDWGRGVWPYNNNWLWGSGSVLLPEGDRFGWNIGHGFGNTSAATEDMLFYNGISHKLKEVKFEVPKGDDGKPDYLKPWTFTETDGRFEMTLTPIIDRQAPVDFKVVCMITHQVFGLMNGTAILDDGQEIEIHDVMAFVECVHNRW